MMLQNPVVDLHCDLLFYLQLGNQRTPFDLVSRCALPQLQKGNVKLQTMAVFTETGPHSVEKGMQQVDLYQKLPVNYPKEFEFFTEDWMLQSPRIGTCMAYENASGFCAEKEPLSAGIQRLKSVIQIAKPLYISLTWNTENRFGGGVFTQIGLKDDGKKLLEELDGLKIALDLSHASDALANEAIDYIVGHRLNIPLMASHSNARAAASVPRNLSDPIAKEIFRRKGVIGFNFFRPFVGETPDQVVKHFAHWLELGGEDHLVFGADFFNDADIPDFKRRYGHEAFFQEYANAACYPALLVFLQKELRLTDSHLAKISHLNALTFIKNLL